MHDIWRDFFFYFTLMNQQTNNCERKPSKWKKNPHKNDDNDDNNKYIPRSTRRSRWPWHLKPWHPRFCTSDGQCLPPFSGAFKMDRVRDIIPVPHETSHSLQTPHSLTVQSITVGTKKKKAKRLKFIAISIATTTAQMVLPNLNGQNGFSLMHFLLHVNIVFLP